MEDISWWFKRDPTWQSEYGVPANPGYSAIFWYTPYISDPGDRNAYWCTFLLSDPSSATRTPLGVFWDNYRP